MYISDENNSNIKESKRKWEMQDSNREIIIVTENWVILPSTILPRKINKYKNCNYIIHIQTKSEWYSKSKKRRRREKSRETNILNSLNEINLV